MPKGFKVNHANIGRLLKSQGAQALCDAKAEQAAAHARSIARVDSGDYRDSIKVVPSPTPNRARTEVRADISYGLAVEARDNTLARALESVRE